MDVQLRPVKEQVIVITGASSGIGLATARMAADRGARVVVAARNEDALRQFCDQVRSHGGQARYVVVDVASEQDVRRLAGEAVGHFGGFDTWVNNAGVSVYGPLLQQSVDDARRLFETNFWGVVNGSRIAAEHLRTRGGAIINVGSEVSDLAAPMQGYYSATKHAVKGFTDALRMELQQQSAPISVTLIKPGPINTPFTQHAKNLLPDKPTHVPPVYAPETVAEAILHSSENIVRELYVGGGAKAAATLRRWAPSVADKVIGHSLMEGTHSGKPNDRDREGALYKPGFGGEEHGDYEGHVMQSSMYTSATMHPVLASAIGLGAALAVAGLFGAVPKLTSHE